MNYLCDWSVLCDCTRISNLNDEKYSVSFLAKHADGNFDIRYALIKP